MPKTSINKLNNNMEALKLDKQKAKQLFPRATEFEKEILISTFGKEFFSGKITDRIKTYEDAYSEADDATKRDSEIFPTDTEDVVAYKKLKLIAKVLRGDWQPDWNNSSQYKWFPFFKCSSGSGFGFSFSYYNFDRAFTNVGSRLCFPTEELATYFGKQFIEIHNQILTINK